MQAMKKGNVALTGIALAGGALLVVGVFQLTMGKKAPPTQVLKFAGIDETSGYTDSILKTLENHGKVETMTFAADVIQVTWKPEREEWIGVAQARYPDKLIMQHEV
jgi:hypothetical protein